MAGGRYRRPFRVRDWVNLKGAAEPLPSVLFVPRQPNTCQLFTSGTRGKEAHHYRHYRQIEHLSEVCWVHVCT